MNCATADKKLGEARRFLEEQNFGEAVGAYEAIMKRFAHDAWIWYEYGCAACGTGQFDLAERTWLKARELEPNNCEILRQMGLRYQDFHLMDKAMISFERAIEADSRSISARLALATLQERSHRLAEARETVASCQALDPLDERARCFAALLDWRENKIEEAERELRDVIASGPRHPEIQYGSRYQLAELLDRTERYDEAMETLAEAKKLVRGLADIPVLLRQYDTFEGKYRHTTKALPANIVRTWSKEFPEKSRVVIPRLAYLGGHPRSGTTLLEQVLGAHPETSALDEPKAFAMVVVRMFNAMPQLSPARLNLIRRRYVEALQMELGAGADNKLLLDKNPIDAMKLCIWLRVFPELRVIMALRDPRDVIISCYFQNLALNPFTANFLFLERAARHYANFMDIWLAARQWEGFAWIESRYEDVVANVEKEGRRVMDFLELPWQQEQAQFHETSRNKRMFAPTYKDARQPLYNRSVARWRAYEKYLAPSQPILEPYCRELGY
jgi:tetratricopeptide (TPR) repeat protein